MCFLKTPSTDQSWKRQCSTHDFWTASCWQCCFCLLFCQICTKHNSAGTRTWYCATFATLFLLSFQIDIPPLPKRGITLGINFLHTSSDPAFTSPLCLVLYSNSMYFHSNYRFGSMTLKTTQPNRYAMPAGKIQTAAGFTAQTFLAAQLRVYLAPNSIILALIISLGVSPYWAWAFRTISHTWESTWKQMTGAPAESSQRKASSDYGRTLLATLSWQSMMLMSWLWRMACRQAGAVLDSLQHSANTSLEPKMVPCFLLKMDASVGELHSDWVAHCSFIACE